MRRMAGEKRRIVPLMRPHLREFLELCARNLVCPEPIVEIGAFQVAGQESIADLRPLFPDKHYVGCDMQSGRGVDRIEDIHALSFASGEVGTFILADTLEHVADPIRAMEEVHRCLSDAGVVILSSVMHFGIHGYPNDYWRFTPEAFRALTRKFSTAAIFFAGSPEFPHTVCGVAGKSRYDAACIKQLTLCGAEIKKTAPFTAEGNAARIMRHLVTKLVPMDAATEVPAHSARAGFGRLSAPGWFLLTGQWIEGWAAADDVRDVEILLGDKVIHRAKLNRPFPNIAAQLGLPKTDALIGFSDQVDLTGIGDRSGVLQMVLVDHQNRRRTVCSSAPGLLLGSIKLPTEFSMHSFDERTVDDQLQKARALVAQIRARGEPINVDLGCGFRKKGNVGIDLTAEGTQADLICRLGFEPIPLDDESVDTIFCRDFLEHIPKAYFSERENKLRYPAINLMNEIWRVLKPGGTFTSFTPCYPAPEVHQDPTHLSVWTKESMQYFCGKYPVAARYGVHAKFELVENRLDGFYLHAILRKPIST
jgi:SAM-dependent methyltransferase